MDFYYEVGSRPALKILLLLEFLPTHNINLKDIGELENRQTVMANTYEMLFRGPDGFELFQPYSVMRYLGAKFSEEVRQKLYGESIEQRAVIDQWLSHYKSTIFIVLNQLYDVILGHRTVSKSKYLLLNHDVKLALQQLDNKLKIQTYLCGSNLTIVDIAMVCELHLAYRFILSDKYKKNISYLVKWFERVLKREEVSRCFGTVWPCKKQLVPEHFTAQDAIMSDNSIGLKRGSFSMMPSEESMPILEFSIPQRNQLAFDYLREMIREGQDRKNKLSFLWPIWDLLHCSIWKIEANKLEQNNIFESVSEHLQMNFGSDDFCWLGTYGSAEKAQVRGICCLAQKELPQWTKTDSVLQKCQFIRLAPDLDREKIEQFWSNTKENDLVQNQKVLVCTFISR